MIQKSVFLCCKILFLLFCTIRCTNNSQSETIDQKQPSEKTAENSNNWKTFYQGDFYGYEDENGFEMLPAKYISAEEFNNGIAIVETENGFCLIDFNGKILSDFYEEIISDNYKDSSTLNYIAKKISNEKKDKSNENSFGLNDLRMDLPPDMEDYEATYDLYKPNSDSFCLISKNGQKISPYYNDIESNENGFYIGSIVDEEFDKQEFLLDSLGNKISTNYESIHVAGEIFIAYIKQKDYLLNTKGEIISKGYNTINYLSDLDLFEAEIDFFNKNSTGILDKNGAIKIPEKYYEIEWFDNHQLFLVTKYSSRKYQGIYSENFELVKAPEQHIECSEDNPYIAISSGNKFSFYIYENGTFTKKSDDYDVIKNDYSGSRRFIFWNVKFSGTDYILAKFYDGFASVSKNGKFGIINDKFEVILPFEYDFCEDRFNDGKCFVAKGDDEFFVNKKGERVSE